MSSRRAAVGVAVVPLKPNSSSLPVLMSRAVPLRSSIKLNAMRPPTANLATVAQQTGERNEVSSRVVATSKTSALVSSVSVTKDLTLHSTNSSSVSNSQHKMSSKAVTTTTTSKPPLWQSMKSSLGSRLDRVSPSSNKQVKEKSNKEEQMATSTGTESSGVFSSSENGSIKDLNKESTPVNNNNRRPTNNHHQSSTSRLTAAMAKTTSRLVSKRPATATATSTAADQAVIVELRNQIHLLKNQHHDQLEQLNRELSTVNDKLQKEMTIALAEKENQFQQQLEAKEAAWRAEWAARMVEERAELERQLGEERAARAESAQAAVAVMAEERRIWQQKMDVLLEKKRNLLAEKERLDKNIRQEVDNQVQATVYEYKKLQKETTSLQAVCDLRGEEVRTLRNDLAKVTSAANEVPHLRERINTLGNTVEDLKAQLEQKISEERRLQSEVKRLESSHKEESLTVQRLSMQNEQLWYKLQSLQRRPSPTHTQNDCDRTSPTKGHAQSSPFNSTPSETPKLNRRGLPSPNLSPIISESGTGAENNNNNNSIASLTPDGSGGGQVKRRRDAVVSNGSGKGRAASALSDVDDVFSPNTTTTTTTTTDATMGDSTPPELASGDDDAESPTVRDFTKKNDSVSYVLELGGEHSPLAICGGISPLSAPYLTPGSPWTSRRSSGLVRSASLRYPHRPYNAHH